jgi:hypothetical protein
VYTDNSSHFYTRRVTLGLHGSVSGGGGGLIGGASIRSFLLVGLVGLFSAIRGFPGTVEWDPDSIVGGGVSCLATSGVVDSGMSLFAARSAL